MSRCRRTIRRSIFTTAVRADRVAGHGRRHQPGVQHPQAARLAGRARGAGRRLLRYGYENSAGDLIHVFDADFAPRADMTRELAPYFADHRVGIVQSPQFFDVQQDHFNWLQRSAGATQEMFYRWIQPARDAVDAAICVGTNAVYRRSALRDSGGFAQIGHSEDVHTGVNMAKVGFRTRYVPVNLAKGVCPDNFDGFANQQYRWCTGSMSLLADPGFHRSALSVKQKLRFWTGFGRRVHQNGSHGLDHGYGNAMMLLGGGVVGGKVHGRWPGLGERQLVDGDLAVTTDYRSVIGEILHKRCGLANTRAVFPNVTTTTSGVVRSR